MQSKAVSKRISEASVFFEVSRKKSESVLSGDSPKELA